MQSVFCKPTNMLQRSFELLDIERGPTLCIHYELKTAALCYPSTRLNNDNIAVQAVMAIGDGGNDLPLLQSAGLGIAMGNAVPEVSLSNCLK